MHFQLWNSYIYQKIVFINITSDLILKFIKYWEAAKLTLADTIFQNSNLHLTARIFYWSDRLTSFLRNVHQISKHVFILFFQYNIKLGISWKSHLQWLIAQTIAQVLFPPGNLFFFFSFWLSHVACGILSSSTRDRTCNTFTGSRFTTGPSGRCFHLPDNVLLQHTVQVLYTYFPFCLMEHFKKCFAKLIIFNF